MSEIVPPYGATLAGWYTLRYPGKAPMVPCAIVTAVQINVPGMVLLLRLNDAVYLTAAEAEAVRAVPLPEGLELRYTRGEHA